MHKRNKAKKVARIQQLKQALTSAEASLCSLLTLEVEDCAASLDCCADTPWFNLSTTTGTSATAPSYFFQDTIDTSGSVPAASDPFSSPASSVLDWDTIPADLDPAAGELNALRTTRKRDQLSSLIYLIELEIAQRTETQPTIIDFGAGSGHLGILIAYRNPGVKVILIERKAYSIEV